MESILSVTTAATVFDLTTIADVKADLGITGTDSDALLTKYVTESSLELAKACNRVFAAETVSEQYRPTESKPKLTFKRRPVTSIISVTEDGTLVAAADYEANVDAGLLFRLCSDRRTSFMAFKIVVVYVAGYALPGAAPKDLQKAARALVKAQFLAKGRDPLVRSETVPGVYEVAYWVGGLPGGAEWPGDIERALDAYSNPVV